MSARSILVRLGALLLVGGAVYFLCLSSSGHPLLRSVLGVTLALMTAIACFFACFVVAVGWASDGAARTILRLGERAPELGADLEAGALAGVVGRVVGGGARSSGARSSAAPGEERVLYTGHLLVEDDRGRLVCLGDPSRREVRETFAAGATVFAFGELAPPSRLDPYREADGVATLVAGETHPLWVGIGDRDSALRAVRNERWASFTLAVGGAALVLVLQGAAAAMLLHPSVQAPSIQMIFMVFTGVMGVIGLVQGAWGTEDTRLSWNVAARPAPPRPGSL